MPSSPRTAARYTRNGALASGVLLVVVGGGCAPSIDEFTVGPGQPGEQHAVALELTKNQTTIQGVDLAVGPAGGSLSNAGALTGSAGNYAGQTPHLDAGEYEARASVRYLRLFLPGQQTKTATRTFTVDDWPPGTFDFDPPEGIGGWTYQGVLGTSDAFEPCAPDVLTGSFYFSSSSSTWPVIPGGSAGYPAGALQVRVASTCYPDQADEVAAQYWQINLKSPDVSGDDDWQGIDGVSFRMFSQVAVNVMATLVVEGDNGQDDYESPMANGVLDFASVGGGWTIIEKTGYASGRPVKNVLIRIFGEPGAVASLSAPGLVLLDVVSPIPGS